MHLSFLSKLITKFNPKHTKSKDFKDTSTRTHKTMMMTIETTSDHTGPESPASFSPIVTNTTRSRTKKSVSFYPIVTVQRIMSRHDYTADEAKRTWLNLDELVVLKQSIKTLANQLSNSEGLSLRGSCNKIDNSSILEDECFRGLEGRTRLGVKRRKRIKAGAKHAVMKEQRRQKKSGSFSSARIADAYYAHSEYPQVEAHMVGLRDESEAMGRLFQAPQSPTATPCSFDFSGISGRRSSKIMSYTRSDSTRSISSLASLSTTRRLLTDAFFKA